MPIFDQGYQHWKGALSGHAWRWLAITRHGIRTQLKGRYIRLLLIMAWMPALVLVGALAVWGLFEQGVLGADWLTALRSQGITDNPQAYRQSLWILAYSYFFKVELYFIMLLVTLAGPNLISLDLRYNALPLYLSRPVTRMDYFLGKLGVIAALVAAVAVLPAAAAYVLGVCFSLNLTVVRDTWRLLPASILYGMVIVVSAGTLMLALSSMSRRSLYVGLAWVGMFLIGWVVAGALGEIHNDNMRLERMRAEQMISPPPEDYESQHEIPRERFAPRDRGVPQKPNDSQSDDEKEFTQSTESDAMNEIPSRRPDPAAAAKARLQSQQELQSAQTRSRKTDWRPLFSYMANLQRVGEAILDTDAAWVQVGRTYDQRRLQVESLSGMSRRRGGNRYEPEPFNQRRLAEEMVPQYPWTWSAAVLAALFGLSLCILSTRVKSLDRLK